MQLDDVAAASLVRTKVVHISLVVLSCLLPVWMGGASEQARLNGNVLGLFYVAIFIPFVAFWFGACLEAIGTGLTSRQLAVHICTAFGARLVSIVTIFVFVMAATTSIYSIRTDSKAPGGCAGHAKLTYLHQAVGHFLRPFLRLTRGLIMLCCAYCQALRDPAVAARAA
eukprot:SAG31_NODE_9742_length_1234_cov_1.139207_2_plen_169_part_00